MRGVAEGGPTGLIAVIGLFVATMAPAETPPAWEPLDDALLAETESTLDPTAPAEFIFDVTRIWDELKGRRFTSFRQRSVRKKIWTAEGAEEHGKVEITRDSEIVISKVAGRTIKPDGRILELESKDIFRRELARAGDQAVKTVSFALPGVGAGDVVDYRWHEMERDAFVSFLTLSFERALPSRRIDYELKPVSITGLKLRLHTLNAAFETSKLVRGFSRVRLRDRQASVDEALSPPWRDREAWALAYYALTSPESVFAYWTRIAKEEHEILESCLTRNEIVRTEAARIRAATSDKAERVRLLSRVARGLIRPIGGKTGWSALPLPRRSSSDRENNRKILKLGEGDREDVVFLFCDLAREAGLDVRLGHAEGRDIASFNPDFPSAYFLPYLVACVRDGDAWIVIDPSADDLPFRFPARGLQGSRVLVTGPDGHAFVHLPQSKSSDSLRRGTGEFSLAENGDLSGRLHLELRGLLAARWRRYHHSGKDPAEVATELLEAQIEDAEWTDIEIDALDDPERSLKVSGQVLIEEYARRTGKRLFLQPALLDRGDSALFEADERVHPIRFPAGWLELDSYSFTPPAGFVPESPDAPPTEGVRKIAKLDVRILQTPDGKLRYNRTFAFGLDGHLEFSAGRLSTVRRMFDAVQAVDTHVLTFRREAVAAGSHEE